MMNSSNALSPPFALALTNRWLGKTFPWVQSAILIVLGSLFVASLAQLEIRLPFTPVPISGQTLGVLLVGASLGSKRGAMSLALYLLEGALGLPFFAGGAFGLITLFGPTGGYLFGFVLAAFLVGGLAEKGKERKLKTSWLAFLLGHVVIFTLGVFWLSFFVGSQNALAAGLVPFIPGEVIKTLIAAGMLPAAWKLISDRDPV